MAEAAASRVVAFVGLPRAARILAPPSRQYAIVRGSLNLACEREALAEKSARLDRVGGSQQIAEVAESDGENRLAGVLPEQRDALLERPSPLLRLSGDVLYDAKVAERERQVDG